MKILKGEQWNILEDDARDDGGGDVEICVSGVTWRSLYWEGNMEIHVSG